MKWELTWEVRVSRRGASRQTALAKDLATAKRFRVLCVAGEVRHHARRIFVRVRGTLTETGGLLERARLKLRELAACVTS